MEYDQNTTTASTTQPTVSADACENLTAIMEHQTYSAQILTPELLDDKQARCETIKKQLERRTNRIEGFWALTFNESCELNGDAVTLHARLNQMALTFVSLVY